MRKESTSSQNAPSFTCVVCSKENDLVAVGSCDHRRVCSYCVMKSRLHYDYKKCPICLKILDTIFICEFTDKTPYEKLLKKKEEFYEDEEFDKCQIYYTTIEGKEEALQLRGFNCPLRSCKSETFENINALSEHLNKIHKRFYCPYCLKENKLFLSQMSIYNQKNLEDHIKYGEYDKNLVISPPHPSCPFDNITFFNDEKMFEHMNSLHFICQLCRDKKNIIFYPELNNLLQHYKDNHYCCPFEECISDVYVVFSKEGELLNHLITKHKVENANERLNKLAFERKNSDSKELQHETGEFNFTEYINKIKTESEKFKNTNKNRFVHINQKYINDEGIEVEYQYADNRYNNKNYNNKYNNYSNYNYNNKYGHHKWDNFQRNDNNNYRGRGGKNKRGNKKDYYNNKFNNSNGNNNYYNNFNQNNEYQEYYENNNYNNKVENEIDDNNNLNQICENNKQEHKYNKGKHYNNYKEEENINKKYMKNIDYSFLFSFYIDIIKKFIKEKILSEKINEKLVALPKETIYQIIIMIDKFDSNEKLLELTYLNNFGIDLNIHKQLKSIIESNSAENEEKFKYILNNLELKKLLIIYKYLYICSKKVDNLFYRLDFEQIDEDLYEDFVQREKKEDENLGKAEKERRNRQAHLKQQLNTGLQLLPEDKKVTEVNYNKKNKNLQENKEDKKKEETPINKPKSKISMLLNNELDENKESTDKKVKNKGKKKKGKYIEFNMNDFDLDKDFPKFK